MTNSGKKGEFSTRKRLIFTANNLIYVVFSLFVYTMSLSAANKTWVYQRLRSARVSPLLTALTSKLPQGCGFTGRFSRF